MPLNHEKPSESRIPPSTVSKPHCAVVISSQPVFETTKHNRKPGDTRPVENSAVPMIDVVVALAWRRATAVASRSILVPLAENTPLRIKLLTSSLSLIYTCILYWQSTDHNDLLTPLWYGWRIDRSLESVSTALHTANRANLHLLARHSVTDTSLHTS